MEQCPDRGRVLSDPAHLPFPHAVVEECTIETRVHMTTQLQLCVCEGGRGKERERERERVILVSGQYLQNHGLVISPTCTCKCFYKYMYLFTHQKVFVKLKITGVLPSELMNTVEPLEEHWTLLVTIVCC